MLELFVSYAYMVKIGESHMGLKRMTKIFMPIGYFGKNMHATQINAHFILFHVKFVKC